MVMWMLVTSTRSMLVIVCRIMIYFCVFSFSSARAECMILVRVIVRSRVVLVSFVGEVLWSW